MWESSSFSRSRCHFFRETSTGFYLLPSNIIMPYAFTISEWCLLNIYSFSQAHVYTSESGDCAAFLSNFDTKSAARVMFNNMHYNLPPWSISILPDCRNVVFNTAKVRNSRNNDKLFYVKTLLLLITKLLLLWIFLLEMRFVWSELQVGVQTSQLEMVPTNEQVFSWETFNEDLTSLDDSSTFSTVGLLEQINVTRDSTDYLWYTTR